MPQNKKNTFLINPSRLKYLLDLYKLSKDIFLLEANKTMSGKQRKRNLLDLDWLQQVFEEKIKVDRDVLKRIDAIFNKGLTWLISAREIPQRKKSSIFFRKDSFNIDLNFSSKKLITQYEELKFEIQILSNYINFDIKKVIKKYKLSNNPKTVVDELLPLFKEVSSKLMDNGIIKKSKSERSYLKNLIRILEELNVFVFEFTETWNKKEKSNFNGFFIEPNLIVIKRQKYFRREIFTLIHEFAHYLLNIEEVDKITGENDGNKASKIERWCNDFTFFFLLGDKRDDYDKLLQATKSNNFYEKEINNIYLNTHISTTAIYTRLKIENKIKLADYNSILDKFKKNIREAELRRKLKMEEEKALGIKQRGGVPKPIESKLFNELVKLNYFDGNINEFRLRKLLKIKPEKNINEVIY